MAAAVGFAALVATSPIAVAQNPTPDEIREEQKQVQEDAAQKQGEVDALTEDIDKLLTAIGTLTEARDSAQAAVNAAERKVNEALAQQIAAEERIVTIEQRIADTEVLLQESAVSAFRSHQGPNSEQAALSSDPWQYARTEALHRFANRSTEDLLDEFRALAAELEALREEADRNLRDVGALRDEARQRQAILDNALAREDDALEAINNRLDHRLAEAQYLEDLDAELAAKIRAEEQRIADAIAAAKRQAELRVTVLSDAPVNLASLRGITVNELIADQVLGFLLAMEAEGFTLGGSGYRDNTRQVDLRRAHCGTSEFAIYQMSASQCRPPTARPGRSQHEVGLAIDFTYNGRIISSRNTSVFQAMVRIAPDFGFVNLPSEPWHWSTTGD